MPPGELLLVLRLPSVNGKASAPLGLDHALESSDGLVNLSLATESSESNVLSLLLRESLLVRQSHVLRSSVSECVGSGIEDEKLSGALVLVGHLGDEVSASLLLSRHVHPHASVGTVEEFEVSLASASADNSSGGTSDGSSR